MADVKIKQDTSAIGDSVSTVLMGIITFLVILLTYKWFRSNIGAAPTDSKKNRTTSTTEQDKTKTTCTKAKGDATTATQSSQKYKDEDVDNEEDSTNIDDVLVKASDIKPLDQETLDKMQQMTTDVGSIEDIPKQQYPKAKELEEEVAKNLSDAQLEEEAKVRQNQLAAIYKLMEDNKDRFGVGNMTDVQEQYKLYV